MDETIKKALEKLTRKKQELDKLRPLPKEALAQFEDWLKVELTYTSNTIEGNSLTRLETAEIIEKGTTAVIQGKPLRDQLEALNHAKALGHIKTEARRLKGHQFISQGHINKIHAIFFAGISDQYPGKYRDIEVFIRGVDIEFPQPNKVPYLMHEFVQWLEEQQDEHPVRVAADAHFRFVSIHPFIDGNGRTARLLMNLILLLNSYPMAVIRPEDKTKYLAAIYQGQKNENLVPYYKVIIESVDRSLDAYLGLAKGEPVLPSLQVNLKHTRKIAPLKIGELAKAVGESVSTIRHWTKLGLLQVKDYTEGGYQLYDHSMIERAKEIRRLQREKRLSLTEIKEKLWKEFFKLAGIVKGDSSDVSVRHDEYLAEGEIASWKREKS